VPTGDLTIGLAGRARIGDIIMDRRSDRKANILVSGSTELSAGSPYPKRLNALDHTVAFLAQRNALATG